MTASSALRLAVTRRTLLSVAAGGRSAARATPRSPATAVRTVQSAAVATAAASTSANEGNESILRAMTLAALAAASAAVVGGATLNKEKTECTAIAAVVGKDGSNAR